MAPMLGRNRPEHIMRCDSRANRQQWFIHRLLVDAGRLGCRNAAL